ncbi:tyrosine-type recombinase/integrase [Paenibacillus koleovorans]|uniref:tyrosine-type recombinase/integrase n=1 Tax=Paenibacillus koleovorans TaxID=121608 RepID=UPI000FD86293|nr:site-specific integrase [Paenibacillus koleovorans]
MAKSIPAKGKKKKKLPPGVRERDGRYTYRYSVSVVKDGKKSRKQKETESYPTAEEAYDAGILIKADKLRGKLVDPKNVTLGSWREKWIEDYKTEREPALTTIRNRTTATNSFISYIGENEKLREVTGDDYQRYLNTLKRAGKKKGTIQRYHDGISLMFSDAVRKKIISSNPTDEAVIPAFKASLDKIESGEPDIPKFLEKKQLKHFLNIVRFRGRPQEYDFFLILTYTGLRIGELLALKLTDFDEEEKTISITKTLTVLTKISKYHLGPPKNKSSIRKVAIGETVIKAIKSQIAWQATRRKEVELLHDAGFLFWSSEQHGYPASAINLEHRFESLLEIAKLPTTLTPHSLRHTHVSLLAEGGVDLAVIQERLGHKNDDITRRVYLHVTEKKRKAATDSFEKIMKVK